MKYLLFITGFLAVFLFSLFKVRLSVQAEPQIEEICPYRITFEIDENLLQIPYCSNYILGEQNEAVERAVIVIHGTNRTADTYFSYILNAALTANADVKTIIIAPQFLIEDDVASFNLGDEVLFWTNSGWKQGDESQSSTQHPRPESISSFSAIDTILELLAKEDKYPNLTKIVIAGHSAGGQFVNRFAAGSLKQQSLTQQYGLEFRYVIANPSSYLYFNEERRAEGSSNQFTVPDSSNCSYFNEYKYGLDDLNSYMSGAGASQITEQYPEREVAYLLGGNDTDPNAPDLDKTCAAMFQGEHRLERGTIYYNYVLYYFKGQTFGRHHMAVIPNVGHSANSMFNSECGVRYLFDYNPNEVSCGEPQFSLYLPVAIK